MVSRRLIARHRVDFPEPEGPITTTTSPRLIARLMSCNTCRSPNHLFTWSRTTKPLRGAVPCEEAEGDAAVLMPRKTSHGPPNRLFALSFGEVAFRLLGMSMQTVWSRRARPPGQWSGDRAGRRELDHPGNGAQPSRATEVGPRAV